MRPWRHSRRQRGLQARGRAAQRLGSIDLQSKAVRPAAPGAAPAEPRATQRGQHFRAVLARQAQVQNCCGVRMGAQIAFGGQAVTHPNRPGSRVRAGPSARRRPAAGRLRRAGCACAFLGRQARVPEVCVNVHRPRSPDVEPMNAALAHRPRAGPAIASTRNPVPQRASTPPRRTRRAECLPGACRACAR